MTKIAIISDTHGSHEKVSLPADIDIFCHCGDFTAGKEGWLKFLGWVSKIPCKHKIVVPGNHDRMVEKFPAMATREFEEAGVHLLIDSGIECEGLRFWGCPWTPEFCGWAFMAYESELKKHYAKIPVSTQILLTHGPAYGILDETKFGDLTGSTELDERILKVNPYLHCCGHIHEAYGTEIVEGITRANVSVMNERYDLVNPVTVVEFDEHKVLKFIGGWRNGNAP